MSVTDIYSINSTRAWTKDEHSKRIAELKAAAARYASLSRAFGQDDGETGGKNNFQTTVEMVDPATGQKVQRTFLITRDTLKEMKKNLTAALNEVEANYGRALSSKKPVTINLKHRPKSAELYNHGLSSLMFNIARNGLLGQDPNGQPVRLDLLTDFIFAQPAQPGQAPQRPLQGISSTTLNTSILSLWGRAMRLNRYSIFNHNPGQYNINNPDAGMKTKAGKGENAGLDHTNGGRLGMPASLNGVPLAATVTNELRVIEAESLQKLANNYTIQRNPGNPEEGVLGANAIVFTYPGGRMAGSFKKLLNPATKPEERWGTLDANGQLRVSDLPAGTTMNQVPVTKENVLNGSLPVTAEDFKSLVLLDNNNPPNVIEMPTTVTTSLSKGGKLKRESQAFANEIAVRINANYPEFGQFGGGQQYYARHLAKVDPTGYAQYDQAILPQVQAYAQKYYNEYQAKGREPPVAFHADINQVFAALGGENLVHQQQPNLWLNLKLQAAQSYFSGMKNTIDERARALKTPRSPRS